MGLVGGWKGGRGSGGGEVYTHMHAYTPTQPASTNTPHYCPPPKKTNKPTVPAGRQAAAAAARADAPRAPLRVRGMGVASPAAAVACCYCCVREGMDGCPYTHVHTVGGRMGVCGTRIHTYTHAQHIHPYPPEVSSEEGAAPKVPSIIITPSPSKPPPPPPSCSAPTMYETSGRPRPRTCYFVGRWWWWGLVGWGWGGGCICICIYIRRYGW